MIHTSREWKLSATPLLLGLLLSLVLTLLAFLIADENYLNGTAFNVTIFGIASAQALCQLILFLHLGIESKPRWNLIMFLFMLLIIFVVIGGSLWIMSNLNYNLMGM